MSEIDHEEVLEQIDEMLEHERYEFATDTLEGIKEWIVEHDHCTPDQYHAVRNIAESV